MNTKEAYKLAYGQWRLLSKQRHAMPDKAQFHVLDKQTDMMNALYGYYVTMKVQDSYMDRNLPVYEGSYVQRVDRAMWRNGKRSNLWRNCPKPKLKEVMLTAKQCTPA
jgi:hypothetical protein